MMKYLIIYTNIEKFKLDFNKYKGRLERISPTYTEKELEEFFVYQVKYLEILVENQY